MTDRHLWQWAFLWIGNQSNLSLLHPLDEDRAKEIFTDLSAVGERPTYVEVKAFLEDSWPGWPGTQKRIRELWRRIERNPGHRFRFLGPRRPFYTLDRLVEEHDLVPLERRLQHLGNEVLADLTDATNQSSAAEFESCRAECARIGRAIEDLRALRYGPASVGRWWDGETDQPPSGTRGTLL